MKRKHSCDNDESTSIEDVDYSKRRRIGGLVGIGHAPASGTGQDVGSLHQQPYGRSNTMNVEGAHDRIIYHESAGRPNQDHNLSLARDAIVLWNKNLELRRDVSENSFDLMKAVLLFQTTNLGQQQIVEQIYTWSAAAIWITSKIGRISFNYGNLLLSRFLDFGVLKSGADTMRVPTMGPFIKQTNDFLRMVVYLDQQEPHSYLAPHAPQLFSDLEQTGATFHALLQMYGMYNEVYKALINPHMDLSVTDDDPVHRYGWMFFLVGADEYFSRDDGTIKAWQNDGIKTWCLHCVLFVGLQLPAQRRRGVAEVYRSLSGMVYNESGEWMLHFDAVCSLFCDKYDQDPSQFTQYEKYSVNQVIQTLRNCCPRTRFQFEEQPIILAAGFPWQFYPEVFGTLLYSNLEDLSRHLDYTLLERDYEFDPRSFRQVSRPSVAPRRFSRTPATSFRNSTVSRNLLPELQAFNMFNNSMKETPLSARSTVVPRAAGANRAALQWAQTQTQFVQQLQDTSVDPTFLCTTPTFKCLPPNCRGPIIYHINVTAERLIAKLSPKYPTHIACWNLGPALFYHILQWITFRSIARQKPSAFVGLLNDKQFIRCMLFIAFETIRYTWQIGSKATTDELMRLLNPSCIALAMALELVTTTQFFFSTWIKKRLVELQERTLETQIWREPTFYKVLHAAADTNEPSQSSTSPDAEFPAIAEVLSLYGERCRSSDLDSLPSVIRGIHRLRSQILNMISGRLRRLCHDLGTPDRVVSTTEKCVKWGLEHEHDHRLISNRHIDLYLICCLYAAAIIERQPLKFRTIVDSYSKQPQFVNFTLTEISVDHNHSIDLVSYYNRLFLPAMTEYMSSEETRRAIDPHFGIAPPALLVRQDAVVITSQTRKPSLMIQLPGAADMSPRTHRFSATETPLVDRAMSPGTPTGMSSKKLFGGMAGLPPRVPEP
ncbi:hypothetical protein DFJ77DRAFT_510947 [Powellomyces hirtus]|nr:hypothetical protein DFJ77DRAFT_510947 [Powellomyces hirtus]